MMEFAKPGLRLLVGITALLTLSACQRDEPATTDTREAPATGETTPGTAMTMAVPGPLDSALSAVMGASEIPYPVYPNGTKYRVGGENGLKIVVFQTEDTFKDVDSYYRDAANHDGLSRLMAMTDYVRYTADREDQDPWATHRPGIVIHQFNGRDEREAVGASASARTNIIMSF